MPGAYSMDLRERVIAACTAGEQTRGQIAQQFRIAESTLYDWLQRKEQTGSFAPEPHAGGTASGLDRKLLRELVEEKNDATLSEYAHLYRERAGRLYSIATISRVLKEMKLSRKGRRYVLRSSSSPRSLRSA